MLKQWIHKIGNPACILFFNGWGMDEHAISHLNTEGFDICSFSAYSMLEMDLNEFKSYRSLYLIAWSLGVWVANYLFSKDELTFNKSIAINGTPKPLDNQYGIPHAIFKGTLKFWNEVNREKFNHRVFGRWTELEQVQSCLPLRNCKDQQKELSFLLHEIDKSEDIYLHWDCALVSKSDLIFSQKNQINYWKNRAKIFTKDTPHFPFCSFYSWQQLINLS